MSSAYHALFYTVMIGASIITGLFSRPSGLIGTTYTFESMTDDINVSVSLPIKEIKEILYELPSPGRKVVLYDKKSNKCTSHDLEEYVIGVMMAEMPSWYNDEALKAAAVAVRSYTIYNIINGKSHTNGADVCTDHTHCQAYYSFDQAVQVWNESSAVTARDRISRAVEETAGEVMVYDGKVILAMYYASGYLMTRSAEEVLGCKVPYLESVAIPHENAQTSEKSTNEFSINEFFSLLSIDGSLNDTLKVDAVWDGNKCLGLSVELGKEKFFWDSAKVRKIFSLKSGSFYIEQSQNAIVFNVYGYGHGVGMSQEGAQIMAENGRKYKEILKKYYTGINFGILQKYE